jgi:hypothetical protein
LHRTQPAAPFRGGGCVLTAGCGVPCGGRQAGRGTVRRQAGGRGVATMVAAAALRFLAGEKQEGEGC